MLVRTVPGVSPRVSAWKTWVREVGAVDNRLVFSRKHLEVRVSIHILAPMGRKRFHYQHL